MAKGFVGREKELKWLRERFEACAQRDAKTGAFIGGPQLAVIVAESGLGKSRLVQALYQELSTDPKWDPPEINYWPDAFDTAPGKAPSQIRVNPDMKGHVPAGNPRFMWLGTRWTDPGDRNAESNACKVVDLRRALDNHVQVLMGRQGVWDKICNKGEQELKSLRSDWPSLLIGTVADKLLPFGGLMAMVAQAAWNKAREGKDGVANVSKAERRAELCATDQVVSELREVMADRACPLPVVLWLDDGHWMDVPTREAVDKLWRVSVAHKLPLLIVATHWEREWEMADKSEGLRALAIEGGEGATIWRLGRGGNTDLGGMLSEALPGLTPRQNALLVQKADGNYLTMLENISDLQDKERLFEEENSALALTEEGETEIQDLAGSRVEHVRKRFSRLDKEIKRLLGWSSHLGMRFLSGVVVDFARAHSVSIDVESDLERCERPLVILATPEDCPQTREWRDRAFLEVAREEFAGKRPRWAADLEQVLRGHLTRWINNSFDADGDVLQPPDDESLIYNYSWSLAVTSETPKEAAIHLDAESRRELLCMAQRELPLPAKPNWDNPEHAAALRCRILCIAAAKQAHCFDDATEGMRQLFRREWGGVTESLLSSNLLQALHHDWTGLYEDEVIAEVLAPILLSQARTYAVPDHKSESCDGWLAMWLYATSRVLRYHGDPSAADALELEATAIHERSLAVSRARFRLNEAAYDAMAASKNLRGQGNARAALEHLGTVNAIAVLIAISGDVYYMETDTAAEICEETGACHEALGDTNAALAWAKWGAVFRSRMKESGA